MTLGFSLSNTVTLWRLSAFIGGVWFTGLRRDLCFLNSAEKRQKKNTLLYILFFFTCSPHSTIRLMHRGLIDQLVSIPPELFWQRDQFQHIITDTTGWSVCWAVHLWNEHCCSFNQGSPTKPNLDPIIKHTPGDTDTIKTKAAGNIPDHHHHQQLPLIHW